LFGMGHGTRIGLAYAARFPTRVGRLILCGASTCGRVARGQTREEAAEEETRLNAMELGWQTDTPAYAQFLHHFTCPMPTPKSVAHTTSCCD
jgi:pimeloyl-ACP methyl ester carboxylesterase